MKPLYYLTNAPTPYKTGMFDEMSKSIPQFKVLYLTNLEYMRNWTDPLESCVHEYQVMKSHNLILSSIETAQYFSFDLLAKFLSGKPRAVIIGPYSQLVFITVLVLCLIKRVPVAIWYESHDGSSVAPDWLRGLGRFLKGTILRTADAVVVPGRLARESALALEVSEENLFTAPHSTNAVLAESRLPNPDERVRKMVEKIESYDLALLYVGQILPRKNVELLLSVMNSVQDNVGRVCLVVAGGELPSNWERPKHLVEVGFLQKDDLAWIYRACDGLVLPSRTEVWGLVVNEALSCGLPVIVTRSCGASEMVRDGIDGLIIEADDPLSLRQAILEWKGRCDNDGWHGVGLMALEKHTFRAMADAFVSAINRADSRRDRG